MSRGLLFASRARVDATTKTTCKAANPWHITNEIAYPRVFHNIAVARTRLNASAITVR
ncbi:hypothetical protein BQ8794_50234 [Mesorhizobium prunaredense]|uniref:Uncharacterized protein n=1 Tax=Mesorhizobium prunaredense TaxID=1631249 RepID=A0A1R3VFV7_9HYPH|nr:hypothetical protein BQ8794_50234 [Mesorhizobium prunaredense]